MFARQNIILLGPLQPSTCQAEKMQLTKDLSSSRGDWVFNNICPWSPWNVVSKCGCLQPPSPILFPNFKPTLVDQKVDKNGYYHLYFDNFFSTFRLMKSLLEKRIYATATTRPNRKGFPVPLKTAKLRHVPCVPCQCLQLTRQEESELLHNQLPTKWPGNCAEKK